MNSICIFACAINKIIIILLNRNSFLLSGFLFLLSLSCNAYDLEPMSLTDEVEVNILSGQAQFNIKTLEIGTLSHYIRAEQVLIAPIDNFTGSINKYNATLWVGNVKCQKSVYVDNGSGGGLFCFDGVNWLNGKKESSTLIKNGGEYVFTDSEGSKFFYTTIDSYTSQSISYDTIIMYKIDKLSGERLSINYRIARNSKSTLFYRIQSVNSSLGYQLKYEYPAYNIETVSKLQFRGFSRITGINNSKQYCSIDDSIPCSTTQYNWPKASFSYNSNNYTYTIKDYQNRDHILEHTFFELTQVVSKYRSAFFTREYTYGKTYSIVFEPQSAPNMISGKSNLVMKVTQDGREWLYSYQGAGPSNFESKSVNSEGQALTVLSSTANFSNTPVRVNHIDGSVYNLDNNIHSRLNNFITSGGIKFTRTYDDRGNIIQVDRSHTSLSTTSKKSNYDDTCSNYKTCNKPNWIEDANFKKSFYEYYPSGLLKSSISPANRNNLTPETRYFYISLFPYTVGSAGQIVKAELPVWVIDKEISCKSSNSNGDLCTTSGDEVITSYEYSFNGSLTNLLPIGKVISASGIEKRWCFEYDIYGNVITETEPLANLSSCQ